MTDSITQLIPYHIGFGGVEAAYDPIKFTFWNPEDVTVVEATDEGAKITFTPRTYVELHGQEEWDEIVEEVHGGDLEDASDDFPVYFSLLSKEEVEDDDPEDSGWELIKTFNHDGEDYALYVYLEKD
jgi:hypothetical protein